MTYYPQKVRASGVISSGAGSTIELFPGGFDVRLVFDGYSGVVVVEEDIDGTSTKFCILETISNILASQTSGWGQAGTLNAPAHLRVRSVSHTAGQITWVIKQNH